MNHSQIEAIFVNQSILGRVFNSGSIEISGIGGTRERFHQIANPLIFRRVFQETTSNN
ncbi:PH domain-containing protein [Tenacibaculum tangerinum]|uniref:PH domain-containing protein n=1 Tax=Tenacibaculum tangerinum TaxID=3038772 RepID=UPI00389A3205